MGKKRDDLQAVIRFYDKVPTKFAGSTRERFAAAGVRVVPPAAARRGAYIAPNVVLMPSYVNIGAYVDEGTMVDTWATVGSCAQIGRNVHLSGGVGIGGVLEPLQANPTIIEDNCFIGARSEVVEGVIVEENSVLGMGVFIGQSTKIYDRVTGEVIYGRVPAGSVVVAGSLPSSEGNCQPVLRGHRQAGRRADAREDQHQRAAARRLKQAGPTNMSVNIKSAEEIDEDARRRPARRRGARLHHAARAARRHDRRARPAVPRLHGQGAAHGPGAAQLCAAGLRALPGVDLHVGQPCRSATAFPATSGSSPATSSTSTSP